MRTLTEGSIVRNMLATAYPMIVAMTLQTGFNIVDAIFVGKISPEAIAAVSLAFPIMFFMFALAGGVGMGCVSLIARLVGAKNLKKAGNVAEHSLFIAMVISVVFSLVGFLLGKQLFMLMGADSLTGLALDYMNIIFAGNVFLVVFVVSNSILRGEGDMKTPMRFMVVSTLVNVILDPIFIFAFGWGVKGAAYATIVSGLIGCILVLRYLFAKKALVKLDFSVFRYDFRIIRQIFSVGFPASISQMSMALGIFFLTKLVSSFGPYAIAAYGIGFRLESLAVLPVLGLMTAVVTLVGQNVGANKFIRAEKTTYAAIKMSMAYLALLSAVFLAFPRMWVSAFNNHPEVVGFGVDYIRIIAWTYVFIGIGIPIAGAFLGSGHAFPAMAITLLRVIVLAVPLAFVFSRFYSLNGVWIGIAVSTVTSGFVSMAWFKLGSWKNSLT